VYEGEGCVGVECLEAEGGEFVVRRGCKWWGEEGGDTGLETTTCHCGDGVSPSGGRKRSEKELPVALSGDRCAKR
jgi:hypothetical protein